MKFCRDSLNLLLTPTHFALNKSVVTYVPDTEGWLWLSGNRGCLENPTGLYESSQVCAGSYFDPLLLVGSRTLQ